nr:ATP-binding protein [Nocardia acidivorans]
MRLVYSRLLLTISVSDEGGEVAERLRAEQDSESQGYGLIGMNERAVSVGGHLRAGRRPDGGFEVTTELPLEPPKTPEPEEQTPWPFGYCWPMIKPCWPEPSGC